MPLLLIFIVLPLLELWLLIKVGGQIGALITVSLVVVTAVLGVALLRYQGLTTLLRANRRMQVGEVPATEMGEGVVLAVAGALLLTPGFFTDAVGFVCLVPGLRRWLLRRLFVRLWSRQVRRRNGGGPGGGPTRTIEGDYRRED